MFGYGFKRGEGKRAFGAPEGFWLVVASIMKALEDVVRLEPGGPRVIVEVFKPVFGHVIQWSDFEG